MPARSPGEPTPRTLVWATDIDVLPADRILARRGEGYLLIRSPGNPGHYWGNLLLFDEPPAPGDGARWTEAFAREFADEPLITHRTFAWEGTLGELGAAEEEFVAAGYLLERTVGLVASAGELRAHRRENRDVRVQTLDPAAGADEDLWEQVIELQVAGRDERFEERSQRAHLRSRQEGLRTLFRAGRGAWYVALDEAGEEVLGSCGIVRAAGRGRFQAVDTAAAHRRRGICSRLLVEAARRSGAERLVICADPGYHALGLYESLGFRAAERVAGVCLEPPAGS